MLTGPFLEGLVLALGSWPRRLRSYWLWFAPDLPSRLCCRDSGLQVSVTDGSARWFACSALVADFDCEVSAICVEKPLLECV